MCIVFNTNNMMFLTCISTCGNSFMYMVYVTLPVNILIFSFYLLFLLHIRLTPLHWWIAFSVYQGISWNQRIIFRRIVSVCQEKKSENVEKPSYSPLTIQRVINTWSKLPPFNRLNYFQRPTCYNDNGNGYPMCCISLFFSNWNFAVT